jgi:hypothetical protein
VLARTMNSDPECKRHPKDDGLFFGFAKRIQPSFHTPSGAVLFQGCVAILLALTGTYQELYSFATFAIRIFFWIDSLRACPTARQNTRATSPVPSVRISLDTSGLRCSGFSDIHESGPGTAAPVVHWPGYHAAWYSFLSYWSKRASARI